MVVASGDVAGFSTQITRIPSLGLGVSVFSNEDAFGDEIVEIVKWRIIDDALGLTPIDWDSRSKASLLDALTSSPTPTPRPINASSPVPFTSLADSYSNPAYGSVELCLIPSSKQSTSAACKSLKASLPTVLPNVLDSSIPTLVGTVDRLWNYLVLASFDGGIYNASLIGSSPPVGSTGPNTVQVVQSGVGEFAFDSNSTGGTVTGFGLSGVWGANTTAEPTGTTVEARSEVFYTKH